MTIGVWLYYHPEIVQGIHLALIGIGVAIVCCAMIWRFFMQKKPVIICRDEVVLICCTVILALRTRKGIACWLFIAIAATLQILGCLFPRLRA